MKEHVETDERLRFEIGWTLWKMGFFKSSSWCECLIEAIAITAENPKIRNRIRKQLYPAVAEVVGISSENVERRIRNAIEVTFSKMKDKEDIWKELFGNSLAMNKKFPSNEEFITVIAEEFSDEPRKFKQAGKHLRMLGIPINCEGYDYFKKAVEISLEDPEIRPQEMCRIIATEFEVTDNVVKVAMHRARKKAEEKQENSNVMQEYFGNVTDRKPNTKAFIEAIRIKIIKP